MTSEMQVICRKFIRRFCVVMRPVEALIDSRTLKKRYALVAHTEIQQTQEL